jgi:hypothetical protein
VQLIQELRGGGCSHDGLAQEMLVQQQGTGQADVAQLDASSPAHNRLE